MVPQAKRAHRRPLLNAVAVPIAIAVLGAHCTTAFMPLVHRRSPLGRCSTAVLPSSSTSCRRLATLPQATTVLRAESPGQASPIGAQGNGGRDTGQVAERSPVHSEIVASPERRKRDIIKQAVRSFLLAGRKTLQQRFSRSAQAQQQRFSRSAQALSAVREGAEEQSDGRVLPASNTHEPRFAAVSTAAPTARAAPDTPPLDERLQDTSDRQYRGEALVRTRVVSAPLEACFAVASDLDSYKQWCHHGLKELDVLHRLPSGHATEIKMDVGKFGIRAINTLRLSYKIEEDSSQLDFTCIKVDAIPKINASYSFTAVSASHPPPTLVSYQLDIGFGFALPDIVRDKFVGAIVKTALDKLEARILAEAPFDPQAHQTRLLETVRQESLGATSTIQDVQSHVLSKSVLVPASLAQSFAVASNLSGYMEWCGDSGLEHVHILELDQHQRPRKIEMIAGKFGLKTANTLLYSYTVGDTESQVAFKCMKGDVMPKLDGRYILRDVSSLHSQPMTEVTYELDIGFAMGIPAWTHKAIVGIILSTALGSFKKHIQHMHEPQQDFFTFIRRGPF